MDKKFKVIKQESTGRNIKPTTQGINNPRRANVLPFTQQGVRLSPSAYHQLVNAKLMEETDPPAA